MRKMGDQYVAHASLRSRWELRMKSGMRDVSCEIRDMALVPRDMMALSLIWFRHGN